MISSSGIPYKSHQDQLMTQRSSAGNLNPHPDDIWLTDRATQTFDANSVAVGATNSENEASGDSYCRKRYINPMQDDHGSQTSASLPIATASPVQVPGKRCIRSSVEGLNQEIEKLVLCPVPAGRSNRLDQVSALRGVTPECTTPVAAFLPSSRDGSPQPQHSDESSSGSPPAHGEELLQAYPEASPRINRFLSQLPPEGCERVQSKTVRLADDLSVITPVVSFQLLPSEGSAFNRV